MLSMDKPVEDIITRNPGSIEQAKPLFFTQIQYLFDFCLAEFAPFHEQYSHPPTSHKHYVVLGIRSTNILQRSQSQ
jgi:hypothetical protein